MKIKKVLSLLICLAMVFSLSLTLYAADSETADYRNIIIMIGDGMGENHLKLAEEYGHTLFMNTNYDLRGQSKTRSLSSSVTDSAAGGTALSSGTRIINHTVGVFGYDPLGLFSRPKSIAEIAREKGMKTGIVTTDDTSGATPAAFSVHVPYRKMYDKIAQEELKTDFDLFWGKVDEKSGISRADIESNGWTYVGSRDEMEALEPGSKSFGQFKGTFWRTEIPEDEEIKEDEFPPYLDEMSKKAIELLNTDNEKGFFLMIEGAHIDMQSHLYEGLKMDFDRKRDEVVDAVVAFDNAVREVVNFAREDGHTVVLVTADHETGWLFKDHGKYKFHYNEHTGANVPVFVFCADDLFKPGEVVKNYTIPGRLTALLGWSGDEFPAKQDGPWKTGLKEIMKITG